MGVGFGCLYLPAPALVSMHFQKHQSLAMGLSSSGSGIGAVIFPLVFTQLEPRIGFGWATRVLGFILVITLLVPIAVMRFPKSPPVASMDTSNSEPLEDQSQILGPSFPRRLLGALVDASVLHDIPCILMILGLLTTFMGLYTMLYYINLLAMQQTSTHSGLASSTLTILNGASTLGRILPSALADRIGPTHVLAATALLSGVLAFAVLSVSQAAGVVVWAVAFGSIAGAFMGLPAAGIVSISKSRGKIGVRLGMTLGVVGCGVLIAEPVAGAILGDHHGGWVGFTAWAASLMTAGGLFMGAARLTKVGYKLKVAV